jgi:hypothetical protein
MMKVDAIATQILMEAKQVHEANPADHKSKSCKALKLQGVQPPKVRASTADH